MRVLTYLGALQVALPLCLFVSILLARLRDRGALVALVAAYAATQAIVTLVKVLVERDRPAGSDALAHVGGYAFPSGHSATAVAVYGALALIAVRRLGPRVRTAAIAVAVLLAVIVGVTRVYLGVHYPTDVLGGWLLGGAVLAVVWRLAVTRSAA
jgi:undecaprenyl-diphosphatase